MLGAWALCAAAGGCASKVGATSRGRGVEAIPLRDAMPGGVRPAALRHVRDPLPALARPGVLGSLAVPVADLPILEQVPVSSAPLRALHLDGGRPKVKGHALRLEDGQEVASGDRALSSLHGCARSVGSRHLRWEGVSDVGWTAAELAFETYEGSSAGCSASAKRASRVRARALVPGVLYAFRTCSGPCSDPRSRQLLHLLGPGARWLTHSAPEVAAQTRVHTGSFSHATLPFGRAESASAAITVDYASLHEFIGRHRQVPDWEDDGQRLLAASRYAQIQLDVVWMSSDAAPSGRAYWMGEGQHVRHFLASHGVEVP